MSEDLIARWKADAERDLARVVIHNGQLERQARRVLALIEVLKDQDTDLARIAEPDQEPLRAALRTNDEIRIIGAVTTALNRGRDIAALVRERAEAILAEADKA